MSCSNQWGLAILTSSFATRVSGLRINKGDHRPISLVPAMTKFLLWLLVLFFCWPLAILALVLYPVFWIFTLPFRIVGIAVDGVFRLLKAIIFLPARLLGGTAAR